MKKTTLSPDLVEVLENQPLSPAELELQRLHEIVSSLAESLYEAFFHDQTWEVRQGILCQDPILNSKDDDDFNPEDEADFLDDIKKTIGKRVEYLEAAYSFPSTLQGYSERTHHLSLDAKSKREGKPKAQVAQNLLTEIQANLANDTDDFKKFLASETLKMAFTVKINRRLGMFTVEDLPLDPLELQAQWNQLISINSD
jgi:hypothetical protein